MAKNFKGRSLLTLLDYSPEDINYFIDTAKEYKRLKRAGVPHRIHEGKNIALLFEKASTRTRCAFTVAANDLGIAPEYLGKDDIQLGKKESLEDTAIVLGRMFDGIEFRGFAHETVEGLAKYSGVPVWNGLTDKYHPTQALADFMTIQEHFPDFKKVKLLYSGDGRNNVANSLLIASAKLGVDFRIASPKELFPDEEILSKAREIASQTGAKITITNNLYEAASGADVVYTDVWVSMGEEDMFDERIRQLRGFQVNRALLDATHNPNVIFLHCLPAFHDKNTLIGEEVAQKYQLDEMEVTDEVFRSKNSVVFEQAENRVHTIKAIMALTL